MPRQRTAADWWCGIGQVDARDGASDGDVRGWRRFAQFHAVAEIVLARFGIAEHLLRRPLAEHLAGADHVTAIGDLQCLARRVVGDQNRDRRRFR